MNNKNHFTFVIFVLNYDTYRHTSIIEVYQEGIDNMLSLILNKYANEKKTFFIFSYIHKLFKWYKIIPT